MQTGSIHAGLAAEAEDVLRRQHRQELLRSSAAYATAKLAFANAIVIGHSWGGHLLLHVLAVTPAPPAAMAHRPDW